MRVCELPWLFAYVRQYSHGVCYLYKFLFTLLSNQPASHVAAPQCRSWALVNFKHQNGENISNERVLLVPDELVWVHLGSLISRGFQHHSLQILLFTWLMVRSQFGISSVNPVTQPAFSHQSGLVMWGWCFLTDFDHWWYFCQLCSYQNGCRLQFSNSCLHHVNTPSHQQKVASQHDHESSHDEVASSVTRSNSSRVE